MESSSATIAHISDLHISESLWGSTHKGHFKHRHGHDERAFIALDEALRKLSPDLLLLTGDVTRVGHKDSYTHLLDWLYRPHNSEVDTPTGIQLKRRQVIAVPGNHDRFAGMSTQRGGLTSFDDAFDPVQPQTGLVFDFGKLRVGVQRFDSSHSDGSFAQGFVVPDHLRRAPTLASCDVSIAALHHHCISAPGLDTGRSMRLLNAPEVLRFFLASEFDLVAYGHTHHAFFGQFPARLLLELSHKQHGASRRRAYRGLIRKALDHFGVEPNLFSKCRCADGKLPKSDEYLLALYFQKVLGLTSARLPNEFPNSAKFSEHVAALLEAHGNPLDGLRDRRMAISMAPSCCQAEVPKAQNWGFYVWQIEKQDGASLVTLQATKYEFTDAGDFEPRAESTVEVSQ